MNKELSRDELIKGVQKLMLDEHNAQQHTHPDEGEDCNIYYINKIIDLCQQSRWIPIKERQPKIGAYVDCTDGQIEIRTTYTVNGFFALHGATHWMERPELPKKDKCAKCAICDSTDLWNDTKFCYDHAKEHYI